MVGINEFWLLWKSSRNNLNALHFLHPTEAIEDTGAGDGVRALWQARHSAATVYAHGRDHQLCLRP